MPTISQFRQDAAVSLSQISTHMKYIRRYRRSKDKDFLLAFEADFLDRVYVVMSAKNVKSKEMQALEKIRIVHYNSARRRQEDLIARMTGSWRKVKANRDIFINDDISESDYQELIRIWTEAKSLVIKARVHLNADKIRNPSYFDAGITELQHMKERIDELLLKSRGRRLGSTCLVYLKSICKALLWPIVVGVIVSVIVWRVKVRSGVDSEVLDVRKGAILKPIGRDCNESEITAGDVANQL